MKVTAAVARTGTEFTIEQVDLAEPRADEVVVKIAGVGICHTDLVFCEQLGDVYPSPAVLGHEGAGTVMAVGAHVRNVAVGDPVILSYSYCGRCRYCDYQQTPYCDHVGDLNFRGSREDGSSALTCDGEVLASHFFGQSSFAEYALTRESNLIRVSDDLPLELLGPLACGVQTGAGAVMSSLDVPAGSSIVVAGGGSVGLSAVLGAVVRGCSRICVVEPSIERRELALELGATEVFDPDDFAAHPAEFEFALDTTGSISALEDLFTHMSKLGAIGIVGIAPPGAKLPGNLSSLMGRGITIRGIMEGDSHPQTFIPELLERYRAGEFPFDRLIRTYPLAEINKAIAEQAAGLCVKPVLIP